MHQDEPKKTVRLSPSTDAIVGSVRVPQTLYDKLNAVAKKHKVSMQTVIRAVLEECIDDINFK
jgi:predicted DNA-binding ribbon-helix-helix protein